ncbi:MAG: response regulator, partial [Desulfoplanes sp.]
MKDKKIKILVVDDEAIIATQLEEKLAFFGYDVVGRAGNGEKAIAMSRDLRPDLILMDIVMPGDIDGIGAAEIIKEKYNIPVVFLTAYTSEMYVRRAKKLDPLGFVVKPFQDNQLRATIEIAIYKKKIIHDSVSGNGDSFAGVVRIQTLGQFVITMNDRSRKIGKISGKPLVMLKVIVALGCQGINSNTIADIVWPDSPGDLAYKSMTTTLWRLRTLLGSKDAIAMKHGVVSLNPEYCWVDVQQFEKI